MSKRTCPCCGYQTLPSADEPTWLDCPVCLWTDAPADADQAGDGDLVWAQQCFVETGASSEHVIERVRVPNDQEPRDPAWSPLAAEHDRPKANLLATIRDSFGDVIPGEGLSLDEADAADSYREANQPRRHQDWTDVTDEELGQFDAFSFLHADGFRFYIPAFMTWFLRLSPSYRVSDVQCSCSRSPTVGALSSRR